MLKQKTSRVRKKSPVRICIIIIYSFDWWFSSKYEI